ncbi:MAG: cytochrome c3 family protein [Deltaproteobacteria bacterium]|nr:cytochrome c3 family protein [Deltaproteobacteria bacterium]
MGALAAVLLAPAGWLVTDRLESRNDFCNACHIEPGRPLHERIRHDFDARPPADLAAAHAHAGNRERDDGAFRCIDCHGGVGLVGRARVKVLAAKDAFWWAAGRFEEPREMRWPLRDEDCTKCHGSFSAPAADAGGAAPFHAIPIHNVDFEVRCVACHAAHETGVDPQAHFMDASRLRPLCARCHPEYSEGGS